MSAPPGMCPDEVTVPVNQVVNHLRRRAALSDAISTERRGCGLLRRVEHLRQSSGLPKPASPVDAAHFVVRHPYIRRAFSAWGV